MNTLATSISAAIQSAIGRQTAVLHEPCFNGNEHLYVNECLDSTFVSSVGAYVDRFERELAEYTGAKRAVAVVNGTAALQVALQLAQVKYGDEVIVPALTFAATANAVTYLGAFPYFADSDERTLGLDPVALRAWLKSTTCLVAGGCRNNQTGRRISALVPMHTFGHPCDIEGLMAIAHDFNLTLVEDAAESLGSFYMGRHTGTFGSLGTLSFNGNKIITTGGGGAILTNDERLAAHAKHLTTTAKVPHLWNYSHDEVGYNFRMPNLNAALGCAQLERMADFLKSKRTLHESYQDVFNNIPEVELFQEPKNCKSNYWLQALLLSEGSRKELEAILETTNRNGIMTRPAWRLMHQLPHFSNMPRAPLPVAESLALRIINIPSSVGLV